MIATSRFRLAIFTICSNNYIPAAKTFFQSARRNHPEASLFLCLADQVIEMPGLYDPAWTVVPAEALEISDFQSFAFRYDIMEFNTAVKPFMFRHLLDELGYDAALYFDPDIEIFRSLTEVVEKLQTGTSFVLTPHLCAPNEAEEEPNDLTIMRAGVYNLGFLGVARGLESLSIIDWWARRLRFQCINSQEQGIFVDQKFMDLVPGFASNAFISRDTTLNVAYWNLHQRSLAHVADGWTVDGKELTFFHYSGFDPLRPDRLSKHSTDFAANMPDAISMLTAGYAQRLLANGYGEVPAALYAYGHFASGTAIHRLVREMYREWHKGWPDDPFATYEVFLHQPWPGASRQTPSRVVTNFMKFLHSRFPTLANRLDLTKPADVRELADWFVMHAPHELRLDLQLIEPEAARMGLFQPWPRAKATRGEQAPEVTVVGYLRTASGVGEVGRQTLQTLAAADLRVEGCDVALGVVAARNDATCEALLRVSCTAPVQIFNINADQLRLVTMHLKDRLRPDALRINIPFWELSRFPSEWLPQLNAMDEIWAPSRFIQTALAGRLSKPVIYMPVAIEIASPCLLPRARFGLPEERYLFFFAFDFLSFMKRKNPSAAIASFRRAFPRAGEAGLVMKCMNGALAPDRFAALNAEIGNHPDIFLIDTTLDRSDTLGLIAATDAVISLHRSEGLGLLIAEAMLLGKPVIATGYSASREFVSPATGYAVDYTLVPLQPGDYPFAEGQFWAEPDISHAAWLMRRLYDDPKQAAPLVARAADHLRQNHSRTRVAQLQAARLKQLAAWSTGL
jgi:glycosyltransferase involved in cell wall biosynthesis